MKKNNFKSRKGFTLIELLVVIGILAVLAAIAIPSVAGLIDRANVSADDTNANEMTNAIERFTSEYELFCQDIASGKLNTNDLDAAQSRVYNVTGADSREDIEGLENGNLGGKGIDRDTKYPTNVATAKAIVENYTKTSSATYEPKQSDMHFYYSPDCGIVVFSEATDGEPNVEELNKLIISGKDAKGKILDGNTTWFNLTTDEGSITNIISHNNIIPEGGIYEQGETTFTAGQTFPTATAGDIYTYKQYTYGFYSTGQWKFTAIPKANAVYDSPLDYINEYPVKVYRDGFKNMSVPFSLADDFRFPVEMVNLTAVFMNATGLTKLPDNFALPKNATVLTSLFKGCSNLEALPANFTIPNTVVSTEGMFADCSSLKVIPETVKLPSNDDELTNIRGMFYNCTNLTTIPSDFTIPSTVTNMVQVFEGCTNLTGTITFNCETGVAFSKVFTGTTKPISVKGTYSMLDQVVATAENGNVTII